MRVSLRLGLGSCVRDGAGDADADGLADADGGSEGCTLTEGVGVGDEGVSPSAGEQPATSIASAMAAVLRACLTPQGYLGVEAGAHIGSANR